MENNKGRRQELTRLKYLKRVKRYVESCSLWVLSDGEYLYNPKAVDIINDKALLEFKSSSVLCSCWGCSGEYKYKRHEFKKETQRLVDEYLAGDCGELG